MKQETLDSATKNIEYRVYKTKRILNVYKHVDYWFWNIYSAHPYVGCEHACEYCYARSDKYLHTDSPEDFSRIIKVKKNAPKLLKKELKKVEPGIIATGDYQPAEKKFGLSRKMLDVVHEYGFPVHVIEKSDLVVKDIDVLKRINERSWCCVSFSFSTVDEGISRIFEPVAPSPFNRLQAMKEIAEAGILTGANLMPVLPYITDSDTLLEDVIKEVKLHKGEFVLLGGLTLDNNVKDRYFRLLHNTYPELVKKYKELYKNEPGEHYKKIAKKGEELLKKYGLTDRIPRYCLNYNQKVAEKLYDLVYRTELENKHRAWAYRRAAWTIDELDTDIRDIDNLRTLHGIGEKIAVLLEEIMNNTQ
ncbi:MAG: radical SAM protein [Candidatus Methanofastidiosia archaeon]|jgi:DNA repair photolyase